VTASFFLFLPQMRMTHEAIVERAVAAEAAGFEGIAFMDHMAPPLASDQPYWDAIAIAGWVLAKTTSLKAGHLVLCDGFRHPAVLARQALSLDHASGGRFEIGIGSGSVPAEFASYGMGSPTPRQRIARLAESLDVMRALWTGEPVDYDGEYFTLRDAQLAPAPTAPIPITIGGVGPRTLELVRTHADWWNVPINEFHPDAAQRRELAGDARVSVQTMVALLPDEGARAEVTALVAKRYGGTVMGHRAVVGTADEVADYFVRTGATGVDRFYVWFADFAPPATLERFAAVISQVT
jgi:alkanesulfonate monooxygenase SsuD/methylene tetrahydromethanopterin reductase-like flavin-dependent oxidoreductase (luciferase family)